MLVSLAQDDRSRIAIVSGRPIADLRHVVNLNRHVELWGSHGLERITIDGCWVVSTPSRDAAALLRAVTLEMSARWPSLIERKPYGLALHSRGRPAEFFEEAKSHLITQWVEPARRAGLETINFDGGLELRPLGCDKGTIVERLFDELGDRTVVAYLGDDRTDEDAFRALQGRGLSVLVRRDPRPTLADSWIRPPGELLSFLIAWSDACARPDKD